MNALRAVVISMSVALALVPEALSYSQELLEGPPPEAPQALEPEAEEPPGLPGGEPSFAEEPEGPSPGARTLGLAEGVRIALERNFGILSGADNVAASRYREGASRAQFHPRLTPRYTRSDGDSSYALDAFQRLPWSGATLSGGGTFRSFDATDSGPGGRSSDLRLSVSQPLLRGFGPNTTYFDLRNSERSRISQERSFELQRQRLAIEVTGAYYQIVKQRALLGVSRQSLKRSSALAIASEARMKVGLASKLDVFRAELQASQTQDSLVQSQAALESALENFRLLLGLDPAEPLEPEAAALPTDIALEIEPIEILVARAMQDRLELLESRDQLEDQERSYALAKQNLLPQLDVNLNVSKTGFGPTFSDSLRVADTRVGVSVTTSYPLERSFDKANKAIAGLELAARKRGVLQRELEVEAEVRAAVRSLERIKKSVELQGKSVDFAAQQLRLATLRYQRGLASNFDVVDAEGSLVSARTAYVGLLTDLQVARVQLLRATGSLDVAKEFAP